MFFTIFIICLLVGSLVGFLAGLLGIGGGLIVVPVLVYLLPLLKVDPNIIMPMALATSLASIVVTSSSAAFGHHQQNNIPWALAKKIMVSVALGALLGAVIASFLSAKALTTFFASAVIVLAAYMILANRRETEGAQIPANFVLRIIGLLTGIFSSLLGIAGGAILVPTLSSLGVPLRHAIGVATACGVLVATFGSLGYIISGFNHVLLPAWSFGFIYLPALLGIVLTSSFSARYGVKYASKVPVATLKKFFAIFLIAMGIKMILGQF